MFIGGEPEVEAPPPAEPQNVTVLKTAPYVSGYNRSMQVTTSRRTPMRDLRVSLPRPSPVCLILLTRSLRVRRSLVLLAQNNLAAKLAKQAWSESPFARPAPVVRPPPAKLDRGAALNPLLPSRDSVPQPAVDGDAPQRC